MLKSLFSRNKKTRAADIYASLVARARHEDFYANKFVPDTFDGRFELMVMHLYLIHTRLKDAGEAARRTSQEVFDAFIGDMDAGLREAGVGDQIVPKRINKMTRVFYGRTGAYDEIFEGEGNIETSLKATLLRNLYPDIEEADGGEYRSAINTLTNYMIQEYRALQSLSEQAIVETARIYDGAPDFGSSGAN